jgi:hypothetical protein
MRVSRGVNTVSDAVTVGSGRNFRLDPFALPAAGATSAGEAFVIDRDRARVSRTFTANGPTMEVAVPLAAYRGVAVRMVSTGDNGEVRAFVELLHADRTLTLTLAESDTPENLAADWQAWGRALNLPLLVVGQDGSVGEPLERFGLEAARPKPRRYHSYFAKRRPRFLTRRKTGVSGNAERISGREIIARN